ncbi:MAG: hypothetical protein DRP42_04515 [Tenericutes bacterium]|nr:MAG: hypothetical protein DRP42_04515 [Mycoplasmatota bacterium]
MQKTIRVNQKCLVRHQDCKRIFEGSRICFVASPNSEEVALELEIIQQKLREANIEPYIAVEQREFQKDIFCEKICSKIIESQFCIVFLNDVADKVDHIRKPNANVYYEYGLMTAFGKKIIPIQLEGQSLAFNIQSLDTLKYNKRDFIRQIEEGIKMTLLSIEEEEEEKNGTSSNNLEWALDSMGLVKLDRFDFRHGRSLSISSLGFSWYNNPREGRLFFVGLFDNDISDRDIVLNSKFLTLKIKNYCDQLSYQISELEKEIRESPRRTLIGDRLSDLNRAKKRFEESKILVLKNNISDVEVLKSEYAESCKDVEFELDIELINSEKVKDVLGD